MITLNNFLKLQLKDETKLIKIKKMVVNSETL